MAMSASKLFHNRQRGKGGKRMFFDVPDILTSLIDLVYLEDVM